MKHLSEVGGRYATVNTAARALILLTLSVTVFTACVFSANTPPPTVGKYDALLVETDGPPRGPLLWSPKGDKLLFSISHLERPGTEIYSVDVALKDLQLITRTRSGEMRPTSWAADSRRFVFAVTAYSEDFAEGLWLAEPNGSGAYAFQYLTSGIAAAWSPRADLLAVYRYHAPAGQVSIDLYDMETHSETRVFFEPGTGIGHLSWSPDGTRLAFLLIQQGTDGNVLVLDPTTQSVSPLTEDGRAESASWSPDGSMIAYSRWQPERSTDELHVLKTDSSCEVAVPDTEGVQGPAWSPDGRHLAFAHGWAIHLLDLTAALGPDFQAQGVLCP